MEPFTMALIGASLIGGVSNLLGSKDKPEITMADLKKWGYSPYDTSKEITDTLKMGEQLQRSRRRRTSQKYKQAGYDEKTQSYAGEEDIINATLQSVNQVKAKGQEEASRIAQYLIGANANLKLNQPPDESGFSKFVGGAATGLSTALDVGKAFGLGGSPAAAVGGGGGDASVIGKNKNIDKVGKDTNTIINLLGSETEGKGEIFPEIPIIPGVDRGPIKNILNPGGTGGGSPGTSLSNLTGTTTTFNELGSRKDPEFYKLWKYFQRAA